MVTLYKGAKEENRVIFTRFIEGGGGKRIPDFGKKNSTN